MNQSVQQTILDAFTTETYSPNVLDVQQTPVYDTVTIAAGSALTNLTSQWFVNVGSNASKTLALTNMSQPKRLAAPQNFSVQSIRIRFQENILYTDALSILNGFCFEFWIGEKWYQRAPIWMYAAGGGLTGAQLQTTAAATTFFNIFSNGLPTREAILRLNIPIVLGNQSDFYADLNGNNYSLTASGSGGLGWTSMCVLDGYYARAVQ